MELDQEEMAARAAGAAGAAWIPGVKIVDVRPLPGGASSLTYLARAEGAPADQDKIVLKVAPPGLKPVRNRDVLRQARLLRALETSPGVLVPRVLFEDPG